MSNTTLTADIIAKEAVAILENELVMANLVHRGYEDEFTKKVNGYTVGETVSIRRLAVVQEFLESAILGERERIANRLEKQPWCYALPISEKIRNDQWDV